MDVMAELSARQQRPAHPTMAVNHNHPPPTPIQPTSTTPVFKQPQSNQVSPRMRFPIAQTSATAFASDHHPLPPSTTHVTMPIASTRSSQETLSSPSSPQRIISATSTGTSPTKTSSSSSSYEFPTTFTQFHPSNKPTAPLYRPAALRSADHPAPPQPFPRRNSFSFQQVPSVKRDHWKPDAAANECTFSQCHSKFSLFQRRHHCRKCGEIFCDPHSPTSLRLHPNTLQFTDNTSFPLVRGCPTCHAKYQEWLMRRRNRQNSVRSDCLNGERVGVLIRRGSQTEEQTAFDGVAAASVPRDWSWSTF